MTDLIQLRRQDVALLEQCATQQKTAYERKLAALRKRPPAGRNWAARERQEAHLEARIAELSRLVVELRETLYAHIARQLQ